MKTIDEIRTIAHNWEGPKSICLCGHSGDGAPSSHRDDIRGSRAVAPGHGRCTVDGCRCMQFSWKQFTLEFQEATR